MPWGDKSKNISGRDRHFLLRFQISILQAAACEQDGSYNLQDLVGPVVLDLQ